MTHNHGFPQATGPLDNNIIRIITKDINRGIIKQISMSTIKTTLLKCKISSRIATTNQPVTLIKIIKGFRRFVHDCFDSVIFMMNRQAILRKFYA